MKSLIRDSFGRRMKERAYKAKIEVAAWTRAMLVRQVLQSTAMKMPVDEPDYEVAL